MGFIVAESFSKREGSCFCFNVAVSDLCVEVIAAVMSSVYVRARFKYHLSFLIGEQLVLSYETTALGPKVVQTLITCSRCCYREQRSAADANPDKR